jgi:hypothetical protein
VPPSSQAREKFSFIVSPTPAIVRGAFDFHPTLGFSEEYSDNFNISVENKVENVRSIITPGLNLLIDTLQTQGRVSAGLGIALDSANSFGDVSLFGGLSGALQYAVSPRLTLYLTDNFSHRSAVLGSVRLRQRQTYHNSLNCRRIGSSTGSPSRRTTTCRRSSATPKPLPISWDSMGVFRWALSWP